MALSKSTCCLALLIAGLAIPAPAVAQDEDEPGEQEQAPAEVEGQDDAEPEPPAEPEPAGPTITEPTYPISSFDIRFVSETEQLQQLQPGLLDAAATFSLVNDVYTAPQPGTPTTRVALSEFDDGRLRTFDLTGLRTVVDALLAYLNDEAGLIGVVVTPDPRDIDLNNNQDTREGRTQLRLVIYTARVGRVRTLASGDRVDPDDRENNPVHENIRLGSPLLPGTEPGAGDVLNKVQLDNYLYRLNRHPGRRVDAAISAGQTPGSVTLDYLVSEAKPWYLFFQLSNTGTDTTDKLRERFGFVHNQLTGNDDILTIDFITASFDESNAISISYERPFTDRWSARGFIRYSEYTASDVGIALQNFEGEDFAVGGDLIYNLAQYDELFIDLVGGAQLLYTRTENSTLVTEGEEAFVLGHFGVEVERLTDIAQTRGHVDLQWTFNEGEQSELTNMGRLNPDGSFAILTAGVSHSFYLEPVLNRAAWEDISDPDTSTLAHEMVLGIRGQSSLGSRLIPTFQSTAGGAYTVRGYDESAVAGDNSVIATAEYRFHLPRALGIQNPEETLLFGEPFRVTPETVYGQADWDLILKAFIDAAYVSNHERSVFETNDTLVGTGLGFEISYKNNVRFRGDWGIALEQAGANEKGSNRFHFFLTLLY